MHWKSYRTFREFEQQEIYSMDPLYHEIDSILDNLFADGLETKTDLWDAKDTEDETSLPNGG